jgi:hypothetical protein
LLAIILGEKGSDPLPYAVICEKGSDPWSCIGSGEVLTWH